MVRKLLPILLVLIGLGAGIGAGLFLRPAPPEDRAAEDQAKDEDHAEPEVPPEYVKLANQFIIPVVEDGEIASMVVLSLSLEVAPGSSEAVFASEPKLRDVMLQVLFDHANNGGFRGTFTDGANLILLRKALKDVAAATLPEQVLDVLITEIVRQES